MFLCAFLTSVSANAKDGVYAGADVLWSNAKHKYLNRIAADTRDGQSVDDSSIGGSVDLGYKMSFGEAFLAPEIFYDYLNSSSKGFHYVDGANNRQDSLELKDRYGAKLNVGYNIFSKLSGFVSVGVANTDYNNRRPSIGSSYGSSKLAPIYGVGFSYGLTENIALRTSYDYQQFNVGYVSEGVRDRVTLGVLRLGAVYTF